MDLPFWLEGSEALCWCWGSGAQIGSHACSLSQRNVLVPEQGEALLAWVGFASHGEGLDLREITGWG